MTLLFKLLAITMYLSIALPNFMNKVLTYKCLEGYQNALGHRVCVPFGNKTLVGIVVETSSHTDVDTSIIKSITQILDKTPILPTKHLSFLVKMANYYQISLNTLVLAAIPKALLDKTITCDVIFYKKNKPGETKAQQQILSKLNKSTPLYQLLGEFRKSSIDAMINNQCLIPAMPAKHSIQATLPTLNTEQDKAKQFLLSSTQQTRLLWGVTGSGKTEIYAHLVYECLQKKQQALLLVPEISLTPQTVKKLASRLGITPTVIHSQLTCKQRISQILSALHGHGGLIIGTRSALLTAIKNLGLVIVDEEHSDAFRQDSPFFYSARDAAILLGATLKIPVILGSGTPSLESMHNALQGKYALYKLFSRFAVNSPKIQLVTMQKDAIIAPNIIDIINRALANNTHVMLYIGMRGYSRISSCHACGFQLRCNGCERLLIKHADGLMHCHHCELKVEALIDCPKCQQAELSHFGAGSQQVAAIAAQNWPNHPILRIDTDCMSTLSAAKALASLDTSPPTIIVGTQMLTKGHDVPRLNTVVVVNPDHSLYSPDFRSEEKLYCEILQVAGRSGRHSHGNVYIQTKHTEHIIYQSLDKPQQFYDYLFERRKAFVLPPYSHLACLFIMGTEKHMSQIIKLQLPSISGANIMGPVLFPAGMKRGKICYKIMITSQSRSTRHNAIFQIEQLLNHHLSRYIQVFKQIDSHLSP